MKRPLVGTIHGEDWKDIETGVQIAQRATERLQERGVRIEIPTFMRWWEYGTAIQMVLDRQTKPVDILDVGSGWGVVGPALSLCSEPFNITEYEPDQMYWADRENCNRVLVSLNRKPINYQHYSLMQMPEQQFDAVFCISVMEHVSPEQETQCWVELARRVRPGGILFMDVDCVPDPTKSYVCDEMRAHNFTIPEMQGRVALLKKQGLQTIGEPDWNYNGNLVHDSFTFFRIGMERPRSAE